MNANSLIRGFTKNSPTILTALGITGFTSAIFLAIKATPKAEIALTQKATELEFKYGQPVVMTPVDKAKVVLPCYIPTIVMAVASATCIIAGHSIARRRTAVVASLYALAQTTMQEYQQKVIEKIGVTKEELIRGELAQDKLNRDESHSKVMVVTGNGNTLCYDAFSGRSFKSDIESIRKAVNEFNRMLIKRDVLSINDFYEMIGLDPIDMGNDMGWSRERGLLEVKFYPKMDKNDQVFLVLDYYAQPIYI